MKSETRRQSGEGSPYFSYVTTFTELPPGVPDVTVVISSGEFEGQPPNTALAFSLREVRISANRGAEINEESIRRVAKRFQTLVTMAFEASHPDLVPGVDLFTGGAVGRETVLAAQVVKDALERGDNPLQAVQAELNVSKATASRRVRAAKDAGLLPNRLGELK